jgi:phosphohistidine phosphatase
MKYLTLIRHAKSGYDKPVEDIERELSERGAADAVMMGDRLAGAGAAFDRLFCSQAKRAQMTAERLTKALQIPSDNWEVDLFLYTFNHHILYDFIEHIPEPFERVAIIGHNPAISEVVTHLVNEDMGDVPTCAVIEMEFDIASWVEIPDTYGSIVSYDFPKNKG